MQNSIPNTYTLKKRRTKRGNPWYGCLQNFRSNIRIAIPNIWQVCMDQACRWTELNNNNNDFLCANILEDQAQWRDKTKGLSNCVNVEQCVSRWWMDEGSRKLRRIGSIKEICFLTSAERNYITFWFDTDRKRIPQSWCSNRESSGPSFRHNPRDAKWVTTGWA